MNSFKTMFKIIGLLLTGFLLLTCTEDQTPTEPLIDYISPMVEWLYPPGGSELSGVVELRFSVYDEGGIDSACVYINGSLFGEGRHSCLPPNGEGRHSCMPSDNKWDGHSCLSFCTDTLFTLSWNTLYDEDGVYILEARAWDEAGNLGTSPSLVVNVRNGDEPPPEDRLPPDVWWTAPDPGSTLADTVRLRLGIFDECGVDSVLLLKNGAAVVTIIPPYYCRGSSTTIPPYYCRGGQRGGRSTCAGKVTSNARYDKPVQQAVQATLTQAVQAIPPYYCGGGQRGGRSSWTGELTPNATYDRPAQQAVQATLMQAVQANRAMYDKPVQQAVQATRPPSIEGGDVEGYVDYLWDTRTDSDGVYVWEARAWDDSGNMGTSPALLVRVKNNPEPPPEDNSPPVISWLLPEPGDTLEGTVELRFQVLDDVGVDSVKVYLNGREWQKFMDNGQYLDCHVNWITCEYPDGNYIIQIKAWDCSQNVGMSEVIWFHVWNNCPRVIWVPDDYEKIQDAINASEDGDTVRVRSGTYLEGLRIIYKRLWLESEDGPEETFIVGTGYSEGIDVKGELAYVTVRGFTVSGDWNGIGSNERSTVVIYNCIIKDNFQRINGIAMLNGDAYVYNCVVDGAERGALVGYVGGCIFNSIFVNCTIGYYRTAACEYWVDYGWNLFWNNQQDYSNEESHEGDIFENPHFIQGGYRLQEDSPAIDQGNPVLLDKDGSRSDIGIYGGLYAY